MTSRKPQINFQVEPAMKALYEETKACGQRVTRLCAAGLLLMVQNPRLRVEALRRLRDWETEHAAAPPKQIRAIAQESLAAELGSARSE